MSALWACALALIMFASYAVAIARFFSREHGVDWRMSLLKWLGIACAAVHLMSLARAGERSVAAVVVACALYVVGGAIFAAACAATQAERLTLAFSDDVPRSLLRTGIYRHLRHPFYSAYAATWIAGCVAVPTPLTVGTSAVMIGMYVWAAALEERKFAGSPLELDYRRYREEVGAFVPRLRRSRRDARFG